MLSFYLNLLDTPEEKSRFEQLYLAYRQDMYAVAYSILHNSYDAEDAVHQAFLAIANNFRKISGIPCQEIKGYIVIIIRNTSINIYNSNKRRFERSSGIDDCGASVEVDYFERFDLEDLKNAISGLPQIYKDIIYLHFLEGFTVKEISKMLDISKEAVWKRIERAKKLLKSILEEGKAYGK